MTQADLTDEELVNKVLEGNPQIFGLIISKTQGLVISITYKMIKNQEDRKDLMQEVYLKAFDKLSSFKFKSKLSTWIGTITYNTCIHYLNKKKIPLIHIGKENDKDTLEIIETQHLLSHQIQPDDDIISKERNEILALEIEKLSPLYGTLLTMFHKQELSYKEIATITDLNEGTLKSYLYRARRELKINLLKKYNQEEL